MDRVADLLAIEQRLTDHIVQLAAERDAAVKALAGSRARFADSEARRAELEAVIERVKYELMVDGERANHERMWAAEDVLSASPSVVLEDRNREVAARALEAFAELVYADKSYGWGGLMRTNVMTRARNRAAAIRRGDIHV